MTVRIRLMQPADKAVWAEMRHRLWPDLTVEGHFEEIEAALAANSLRGFVALASSGEQAGFAEVSIRPYANGCTTSPVAFLEGIWVEPSFRNSGIGKQLIDFICSVLKSEGHVELCSDALAENLVSHRAHDKWGFEETERIVCFRKSLG